MTLNSTDAIKEPSMKDTNHSFLKVVLAYCLVIGLVLLWSGNKREKTVFDQYLISFRGLIIACNHIEQSSLFFKEVLEFKVQDSNHFILPDRSSITLTDAKDIPKPNIGIRLRVRNGIYKLHERLTKRVASFSQQHGGGEITDYQTSDNNIYFSLVDPSGIKITFYQDRVFSKGS